jgi:hypothetical protein
LTLFSLFYASLCLVFTHNEKANCKHTEMHWLFFLKNMQHKVTEARKTYEASTEKLYTLKKKSADASKITKVLCWKEKKRISLKRYFTFPLSCSHPPFSLSLSVLTGWTRRKKR